MKYLESFGERYLFRLDFRARKAIAAYLSDKAEEVTDDEILLLYAYEGLKSGANHEGKTWDYKLKDMESFLDYNSVDWLINETAQTFKHQADNVKKLKGELTEAG